MVTVGLYLVAWGKFKELKLNIDMPPSPEKHSQQLPVTIMTPTALVPIDPKPHESVIVCDQINGFHSTSDAHFGPK